MATALPETAGDTIQITPLEAQASQSLPAEAQLKLKGRQRLLRGFQRISSSPSLAQFGRKRARSNPYNGNGSAFSSLSLLSPSSNPSFERAQPGPGYVTAPTSIPGTPGINTPVAEELFPAFSTGPSARKYSDIPEIVEDYFSYPVAEAAPVKPRNFRFWDAMPHELKLSIFSYLKPKELVRASIVSKDFHQTCYDGQLWTCFDASEFYTEIPADSLSKIIVAAGPFVKDLNLRGCVQVEHYKRAEVVVKACKNLINATLEGCRNFQRSTLHTLLASNERLANLNLTGLVAVNNGTCKIIARSCPQLEVFNVSWCSHMDTRGIRMVIKGCPRLRDLRAGEVRGWNGQAGLDVANAIFRSNNLERLTLSGCVDLVDETLKVLVHGEDPEMDILENRPLVTPRQFRLLDLSRCHRLTSNSIKVLAHNVPELESLQLGGCTLLTDAGIAPVLATTPRLTHLDLEELSELTNNLLSEHLAKSPCATTLEHLSISYCEALGDVGMLPVVRACTSLRSLDMDNTRISDLVLAEAASMVRARTARTACGLSSPRPSLRVVVYDCQNVTWTGVREVLSRNAEIRKPATTGTASGAGATYPAEVISLKCFYGWQMTVDEHMKRVLKGDLAAAARLERRWAEYMVATEEAGAGGSGVRRRRRRAREAAMLHADEEEGGVGMGGIGRRRRARSGGCSVM